MFYFNDNEAKVLREMIDYCDAYEGDSDINIPKAYHELLGAIRFKVESERVPDETKSPEDGAAE